MRLNNMEKHEFILKSFGLQYIKPKFYGVSPLPKTEVKHDYEFENDEYYETLSGNKGASSLLGHSVFTNIIFKHKNKEIRIDTVLCDVVNSKHIIKTSIQNRPGTVKEYIAEGDYIVNMRGSIIDKNPSRFPIEDFKKLLDISKKGENIKVTSEYLQLFGIYEVVIEKIKFPQQKGFQNTQLFEITCLSDFPIELKNV